MASREVFKFESVQDCDSISEYLDELIKGLKNGEIILKSANEQILLNPQGMLNFSIKVKKKDAKVKLVIELDWKKVGKDKKVMDTLIIKS